MSYKTFIILSISLITIAGLGAWYIWRSGVAAPPASTPSTTNSNADNAPSTSNTPTSRQTTKADVDRQYTTLLSSVSAKQVFFSRIVSSADLQFGSLYALYTNDITDSKKSFPKQTDFSIGVALVDLNHDGVAEAVVYEDLPGFCGSGGCVLDIYKKNGTGWQNVFSVLAYDTLGVSTIKTKGYDDVLLSVQGDVGYMTKIERFVWSGSTYQSAGVVGVWDGATFKPAQ